MSIIGLLLPVQIQRIISQFGIFLMNQIRKKDKQSQSSNLYLMPRKKVNKQQQASNTQMVNEAEEDKIYQQINLNQSYLNSQYKLDQCQHLKIYFNIKISICEDAIQQFYSSILHITKLEIEICQNFSTDEDNIKSYLKLFEGLKDLTKLTSLSITADLSLRDSQSKSLGKFIEAQTQLQDLKLIFKENGLGSNGSLIMSSLKGMSCLSTIQSIHIEIGQHNSIGNETLNILAESLKKMEQLASLHLLFDKFNQIEPTGVRYLSTGLKSLTKLNTLFLHFYDNNHIGSEGWRYLADTLHKINQIQNLDVFIQDPTFGQIEAKTFFKGFQYLKNIVNLSFEYKTKAKFTQDLYEELKTSLKGLKKLHSVSFIVYDNRSYTKENQIAFSKCFQGLSWVEKMQLSIDDNVVKDLSSINCFRDSLGSIKNLTKLSLTVTEESKFGLEGIQTIAETIKNFKGLLSLKLSIQTNRKLVEKGYQLLFESLEYLVTLEQLILEVGDHSLGDYQNLLFLKKTVLKLDQITDFQFKIGQKNGLVSQGFGYVCEVIQNMKKLSKLKLEISNNNDVKSVAHFGRILESKEQLTSLFFKIGRMNIDDYESFITFDKGMKSLSNLQEFQIELEQFEGEKRNDIGGFFPFQNGMSGLQNLISLNINVGQEQLLDSKEACSIVNSLKYLQMLQKLNLIITANESYRIDQQIELFSNIRHLNNLVKISVYSQGQIELISTKEEKENSFMSFVFRDVLYSLSYLNKTLFKEDKSNFTKSLEYLSEITLLDINLASKKIISQNEFSTFSNGFKHFKNLYSLSIKVEDQINYSDKDLKELAEGLGYLENLHILSVNIYKQKDISSVASEKLRASFEKLTKLQKLYIRFNQNKNDLEVFSKIMKGIATLQNITEIDMYASGYQSFSIERKLYQKNTRYSLFSRSLMEKENEDQMIDENSQDPVYATSIEAFIKDNNTSAKAVYELGNILLLPIKFNKIRIDLKNNPIPASSLKHLALGFNNQTELETLHFTSTKENNIERESFLDLALTFSKSIMHMRILKLDLISTISVGFDDLMLVISEIAKMKLLQYPDIKLVGQYQLTNDQYLNYYSKSFLQMQCGCLGIKLLPNNNEDIIMSSSTIRQIGEKLLLFKELKEIKIILDAALKKDDLDNLWDSYNFLADEKDLKRLQISYNQQGSEISRFGKSLGNFLNNFTEIQVLSLIITNQNKVPFSNQPPSLSSKQIDQKELYLSFISVEMDSEDLNELFNWLRSLKQLEKLEIYIEQNIEINSKLIQQFSEDIIQKQYLKSIELNIIFDDSNTEDKTYFSFVNTIKNKYFEKFSIKLGKLQQLQIVKQLIGFSSNLRIKLGSYYYYIFPRKQLNQDTFLQTLMEYNPNLNEITFEFFLHNSEDLQQIYQKLMICLKQQKLRINNVGIKIKSDQLELTQNLFQNILIHTANINLLSVYFNYGMGVFSSFCESIKQFKYLSNVTNLKLHTYFYQDNQLRTIKSIVCEKMKRLVSINIIQQK